MTTYRTLQETVQADSTTPPGISGRTRNAKPNVVWRLGSFATTAALLTAPAVDLHTAIEPTRPSVFQASAPSTSHSARTHRPPAPSAKELVQELHSISGLTWDQLGRLLGVSRRAVHLWSAGGRINAKHIEKLSSVLGVVKSLDANTIAERRLKLFQPREGESSIYDELVKKSIKKSSPISGTPFRPDELLDAR